jgi:hypothetical protein
MKLADLLPPSSVRVERSTAEEVNTRIEEEMAERIQRIADAGPAAIPKRLRELDREWDMERILEANAATVSLVGLALGFFVDRRWFRLPVIVAAFLLQHALQGWCPPVPIFRRFFGIRSEREINVERLALRILRGDFHDHTTDPETALAQASGEDV